MHNDALALVEARQGFNAAWLVWIDARNRNTGEPEPGGFWTGDDHQVFSIAGGDRLYFGSGSLLNVGEMRSAPDLLVQTLDITLTITEAAQEIFRTYDAAMQRIEVHRAVFDPLTMALAAEPDRVFLGTVDAAPYEEGPVGGTSVIRATAAPMSRDLTRLVNLHKSDAALRARAATDGFRRYAGLPQRDVAWGQQSARRE